MSQELSGEHHTKLDYPATGWQPPRTDEEVSRRWYERLQQAKALDTPGGITTDQADKADRRWRALGRKIASGARIKDPPLRSVAPDSAKRRRKPDDTP